MSPLLAPDIPQIERALDGLLDRNAAARVLGMRSPTRRSWPEVIEYRGRRFRLAWCTSELEVRERLDAVDAEGAEGLVVLTPLDATRLGHDVAARLPRGRLEQSDRWAALRAAFRARDVDPRLRAHRWLADVLLERAPAAAYPPPAGGMLDLEAAWRALLEQVLGLPEGRADAAALLSWSLDLAGLVRFASLPDEARQAVANRLADTGGTGAGLVLAAAAAGRGTDALPVGLVCGVIFGEVEPRATLRDAAVRLEPLVGGTRVEPVAGRALADAAQRVLARLAASDPAMARAVQLRAAALLTEVRADGEAALSPALDLGLDARMGEAAAALARTATSHSGDDAKRAWDLVQWAAAHDRAEDHRARLDRLLLAARLARWLTLRRPAAPRSMAELATAYAGDSGFADRARHALRAGDALPEVAAAYARLREEATTRREEENRLFAAALRDWNATGALGSNPLPVEKLLETVIAPLAHKVPVLVLVLDGLSFAVWRALADTVTRLGWVEFCPRGGTALPATAAVLPSVTEVSRTSLLCGRLTRGDQSTERVGFATHPELVAASGARRPPRLFHKADLGPGPELEVLVRDAVADPQQRVVGVVHNAVDAQLAGSDQIELAWSAEGLRQVAALLRVARDAGRVVVVTGDHGHVVEEGTTLTAGGTGDRWRASGVAGEREVALAGGRVLSPEGGQTMVAAWSERIRYAARRGGYHGGASPQEVLIPLAVLGAGQPPPGWDMAPPAEPAWWRGVAEESPAAGLVTSDLPFGAVPSRRRAVDVRQPELFVPVPPPVAADSATDSPATTIPSWIAALLASDAYTTQRRLAGRGAPADDHVQALLCALAARGGRLSRAGLAQALSAPVLRVSGLVSAVRRVLNLDQAQVLTTDSEDIVLDERLLRVQFRLGDSR